MLKLEFSANTLSQPTFTNFGAVKGTCDPWHAEQFEMVQYVVDGSAVLSWLFMMMRRNDGVRMCSYRNDSGSCCLQWKNLSKSTASFTSSRQILLFYNAFLPTIGSGIGKNLKYENWNSTLRDNFCSERQWHLAVSKINNQFSLRILVLTQPFLRISKIIRLDSLLLPPIVESPQRNDWYQWNLMNWLHMYLGELDGSYCTWV